jgi:hypothetical protein
VLGELLERLDRRDMRKHVLQTPGGPIEVTIINLVALEMLYYNPGTSREDAVDWIEAIMSDCDRFANERDDAVEHPAIDMKDLLQGLATR